MKRMLTVVLGWLCAVGVVHADEVVVVDGKAAAKPFPHTWERTFGSGRAILSLRESYRRDLCEMKRATGIEFVRFHAIFHDEVGVYDEDAKGKPIYNFSYVDQIYDGLLENGVKPYVELSFMPKRLAAKPITHEFWYKQFISPPKHWDRWEELIFQFTKHLVERYGIDEVATWYFEVWNEPNIHFWAGVPKQATYFQLYDVTARALKRVDPRLRVGGPATAQAAWVDAFIKHTVDKKVPVDFVSTHVYANDTAKDVFGTHENIPRDKMVCRAVRKVYDQVRASGRAELPIHFSEYNASWKNEPEITDSLMMGPFIADTVRQCGDLVDTLAYWSFSDVFEEQGVVKEPFYGGYGAIAAGNLPKPAFNAFLLLHRLGDTRLATQSESALVTRRADGSIAIALWNLVLPGQAATSKRVKVQLPLGVGNKRVSLSRLDATHGSLLQAYEKMGRPRYPTKAQLDELRRVAALPTPEVLPGGKPELDLVLEPNSLFLIEAN